MLMGMVGLTLSMGITYYMITEVPYEGEYVEVIVSQDEVEL
jgi:hypothetical protein